MHTLQVGSSVLDVDLEGGRIARLELNKVPVLGTFTRLDGKSANTHLSTPNFGTEGVEKYSLPAHGPSRSGAWNVVDSYESFLAVQYDMPKTGTYPTTLRVYQEFYLDEHELTHNVSTTNIGDDDAPVNLAIHYYWHTPKGWENLMLNGASVADLVRKDTHTPISADNELQIPGKPPISLHVERFEYAQLWTGRVEKENTTNYNNDFVCIEPVRGVGEYFGSSQSLVPPDRSFQASCIVSIS